MSETEPIWTIDQAKTQDHWLEATAFDTVRAIVKWDGCIYYSDDDGEDYTHICYLDAFISKLQALREVARQHFGPEWES